MSDSHHDLFGKPALIAGEDDQRFAKLQEKILNHIKPTNVVEQMLADDLINKRWEEERFRVAA